MGLANCSQCGKLYMENAMRMCPDCMVEYDRQVNLVLDYLHQVPRATVMEISKATEVREKVIYDLIKRGSLTGSDFTISYPCEKCGKLIEKGKLCSDCVSQLNKEIGSLDKNKKEGYVAPEKKYSKKDTSKWQSTI